MQKTWTINVPDHRGFRQTLRLEEPEERGRRFRVEQLILGSEPFADGRLGGVRFSHEYENRVLVEEDDMPRALSLCGDGPRLVFPVRCEVASGGTFSIFLRGSAAENEGEDDKLRIASDLLQERGLAMDPAQLRKLLAPAAWPVAVHVALSYVELAREGGRSPWKPVREPPPREQSPSRGQDGVWSGPDAPPWLKPPWG